jgi:hypothetical protein
LLIDPDFRSLNAAALNGYSGSELLRAGNDAFGQPHIEMLSVDERLAAERLWQIIFGHT